MKMNLIYNVSASAHKGSMKMTVGDYEVSGIVDADGHLTLSVTHGDGSEVKDVGEDVAGTQNEFAVRLTTAEIERQYAHQPLPGELPSATQYEITDDQRAAVAAFRDAKGREWKEELGLLWMSGQYTRADIPGDQAALLQQVRNQFGPEWLMNVSPADLASTEIQVSRPRG